MIEKGYVYRVQDSIREFHPVVIMEDYHDGMARIRAVAFTHDKNGGNKIKNHPFPKEFIVENDMLGRRYRFQWEKKSETEETSIMKTGFDKYVLWLSDRPYGKITQEGLEYIESVVKDNYIECDLSVEEYERE